MTWKERRAAEVEGLGRDRDPYVAGDRRRPGRHRARRAAAPARRADHVVVDRHARPGDQWRSRYKSLCLHDPVWYDHLPYLPFPRELAGLRAEGQDRRLARDVHAGHGDQLLGLHDRQERHLGRREEGVDGHRRPRRRGGRAAPQAARLRARRVGQAEHARRCPARTSSGASSTTAPQHPGPDAYKDKQVVVIGSNNSAFDICGALWEVGADVTMVQRSSTHIVRSRHADGHRPRRPLLRASAVAAGVTTFKADTDLRLAAVPDHARVPDPALPRRWRERDKDFYDRLEASGFRHDWGADGSGLFMKYLRRGSGYYIDVGAADLVANGDVPVKQGQVVELTETGVKLDRRRGAAGRPRRLRHRLRLDERLAADIVGQEIADTVGKVWGLGSDTTKDPGPWEGEQRNMWKPTQQEGLWFHGGNLHQSPLLLALPRAAAQGPGGGHPDARCTGCRRCTTRRRLATTRAGRPTPPGRNDPRGAVRQPKSA